MVLRFVFGGMLVQHGRIYVSSLASNSLSSNRTFPARMRLLSIGHGSIFSRATINAEERFLTGIDCVF